VVDTEDAHAAMHPEQCHVEQRLPERSPVLALEIERDDVLILLRRILRVFDRAVRPVTEPFGVLAHPWMVRRRLPREIERDLEFEPLGFGAERVEVFNRAEPWIDGG